MLKFLSKRKRSSKVILMVFVIVLALGLIVVFTPGPAGLRGAASDDSSVAEVGDQRVTVRDLRNALSAYGQQIAAGQGSMRMEDPATTYALYGPQVIDGLIRRKVIVHEAERLGLGATDQEVQDWLRQRFNPWPGPEGYRRQLAQSNITPLQFENSVRELIAEEKLRSYVTAGVQVSPAEVEEDYRRNNTNYTVRWVEVSPDRLRGKVAVNDADLRAFYESNKGEFRINTEQRRARYLFIDQTKAGANLQVPDDELRQSFDPERGVQEVRVSQIVLNIPKEEISPTTGTIDSKSDKVTAEDGIRQKALGILARAQGAEGKPAEDFAQLAREVSDDPKSKAAGGDIGWVNRKDQRETDDPLNRVFLMQKDEISQPILKGDKFYILKVTERKTPSFEEARDQLLKEARVTRGYTRAVEIAQEAEQKLKESKNIDAVASEINSRHGQGVATVKETPFFVEGDNMPELGVATEFQAAIFQLQNPGDVAERLNVTNGLAVAQYSEKRDPHDPPFEEVKAAVEDRYRTAKAKDLVLEQARQLAKAQSPDALKSAADSMGLKTEERASLTGIDTIGVLVSEPSRERIYKLNPGQVTSEPIKADTSDIYVVASLVSRKDPDMGEQFQKERKPLEERLLEGKRGNFFSTYIASRQKALKDENEIKVYEDVIDSAIASTPTVPGQTRPTTPARTTPRRTPQGAMPPQPATPGQ
ncbi:MAG TPA: SurA N-terminal domain-containing protein [Blastocatellia bacterium]|nr:SurA N-terminal domain-containing protein [Blastocatellia bacterium]